AAAPAPAAGLPGVVKPLPPGYPPEGSAPLTRQTRQTLKSAFELERGATFRARRRTVLTGRSWSGGAPVRSVEVSTDGGQRWRPARLHDVPRAGSWVRWSADWVPVRTGPVELLARATDRSGRTQPKVTAHNTQGYLFDAVVRHPVTVS
ncbi:sulfite oxidase, partial [Streptomyces bacillaris]